MQPVVNMTFWRVYPGSKHVPGFARDSDIHRGLGTGSGDGCCRGLFGSLKAPMGCGVLCYMLPLGGSSSDRVVVTSKFALRWARGHRKTKVFPRTRAYLVPGTRIYPGEDGHARVPKLGPERSMGF